MSILVVCPGCHKRFKVSDQFAGKSGACPNPDCTATIQVPTKDQEVKVHAPTEFAEGGRSRTGKLVTKPIAREQLKLKPLAAAAVVGGVLAVVLIAWFSGELVRDNPAVRALGLLLLSPPLVVAAYAFLRNEDLEPHRGVSLYIRVAICSLGYIVLWAIYGYLVGPSMSGELWEWFFVLPLLLATGGLIAMGCLDLDFANGVFHYAFYLLVGVLLRGTAGMEWL